MFPRSCWSKGKRPSEASGIRGMKYKTIVPGTFLTRENRFVARVDMDGHIETVHVKNTGRCRELLREGAAIYLSESDNPARKTRYDLVSVVKESTGVLFNIDSQAPNKVVAEWLRKQDYDVIIPEYAYGSSRIDFYMEKGNEKYLLEVKGCTLEKDGIGYFPDAPTVRGTKHLRELIRAAGEGYHAIVAFVIQMEGVSRVLPNTETDPLFAEALHDAKKAGVEVLNLKCAVKPDELWII